MIAIGPLPIRPSLSADASTPIGGLTDHPQPHTPPTVGAYRPHHCHPFCVFFLANHIESKHKVFAPVASGMEDPPSLSTSKILAERSQRIARDVSATLTTSRRSTHPPRLPASCRPLLPPGTVSTARRLPRKTATSPSPGPSCRSPSWTTSSARHREPFGVPSPTPPSHTPPGPSTEGTPPTPADGWLVGMSSWGQRGVSPLLGAPVQPP